MHFFKLFFLLLTSIAFSQPNYTIKGFIPEAKNREISLKGYGFSEMPVLFTGKIDVSGNFSVQYPGNYIGAALLEIKGMTSVILLLKEENFSMQWRTINELSSLEFTGSKENTTFSEGINLYSATESKRAGLFYLLPLYGEEPQKQGFFKDELAAQDKAMAQFTNRLDPAMYSKYYLHLRKLMADIPLTLSRYLSRREVHELEFNKLNFADSRLVQSGLYKELLQSYITFLEAYDTDKYPKLNAAAAKIINDLKNAPELRENVAQYLFKLYEERSLFPAAEHLALAMLSDTDCQLGPEQQALFEQYRSMAIGKTAPDIIFNNSNSVHKKLSDIKTKYRLVIFGASWCPKCREEAPKVRNYYTKWKTNNMLEIAYISLDTQKTEYFDFTKDFPWISTTDLKGWESDAARSYYVIGTPTMYLLDNNNQILLKPVSPEQIDTWLTVHAGK